MPPTSAAVRRAATRRTFLSLSAVTAGAGLFAVGPLAPAQATPNVNRPSGLPWDSGVFARQNASAAARFAQMRGAALDVVSVYCDVTSKTACAKTWWTAAVPQDFAGTLSLGVPMWTDDSNVWDAAHGGMDWVWRSIARGLADGGHDDAYVRLAWEFNIHAPSRSGAVTPDTAELWMAAWCRATDIFRSVSSSFRMVFNPNLGASQTGIEADRVYPGDGYVDVIGVDAYDWWPAYNSDSNWAYHYDEPYGWKYWMEFTRRHGKTFALPEWGLAPANSQSGGDNPRYVGYVYNYLWDNRDVVEFECYFEETAGFCLSALELNPRGRGTYQWWVTRMRGRG